MQIREGYFGDTRLDGVRFAGIYSWPGAIVLHQEEQRTAAAGMTDALERRELVDATDDEEQSR